MKETAKPKTVTIGCFIVNVGWLLVHVCMCVYTYMCIYELSRIMNNNIKCRKWNKKLKEESWKENERKYENIFYANDHF